jgi:hypothetical protein
MHITIIYQIISKKDKSEKAQELS